MVKRWFALLGLLVSVCSAPAFDGPDPRNLVDTTIETLREYVTREQVRIEHDPEYTMGLVEDIVAPHVDLRLASRLVLGRHWKTATPTQREAFVDGLRRLLLRVFALHIADYRAAEVGYAPTEFEGEHGRRAVVHTAVSRDGRRPVSVDFRLYRSDGAWKVYDISILGVSVVRTYRITIQYDLKKYGLDAVIEQINAKNPLTDADAFPLRAPSPAG